MGKRRPGRQRRVTNTTRSIADPALVSLFSGGGYVDMSGVAVGEYGAMGLSSFYRATSLISGTLASLPLRSFREKSVTEREIVKSVFDSPDGDHGQTPFEWKESLFLHLLLHGNSFAFKMRNAAGGLVGLPLFHPLCVSIELPTAGDYARGELPLGGKWFRITLDTGEQVRWDANDVWHIPAISLDGIRGLGLISVARMSLGSTIAGDRAAANMFSKGALISGIVSPQDDMDPEELPELSRQVTAATSGYENAGKLAVFNRRLQFQPWTMTATDAQFLQSRQFQIEEVSRWTGVPPHLLMQTDKQTSWGTGVEMQDRALGRSVLNPWAKRFEDRGSRLLASPRFVEFDFAGLERPSPETEIQLLISQVGAGLLTLNEARAIRNLPPLPDPAPTNPQEGTNDPTAS